MPFHNNVEFLSVAAQELKETFDVVLAVEVLEHIADDECSSFLKVLAEQCKLGGYVVISVPTTVLPLNKKHYRHYDLSLFQKQLDQADADLEIISTEHIYRSSWLINIYTRFTQNRFWFIEINILNRLMWNYAWKQLRKTNEMHGRHLVVVLQKTNKCEIDNA